MPDLGLTDNFGTLPGDAGCMFLDPALAAMRMPGPHLKSMTLALSRWAMRAKCPLLNPLHRASALAHAHAVRSWVGLVGLGQGCAALSLLPDQVHRL